MSNKSDMGGVLQTNNIHIVTCATGEVTHTLSELKASPATSRAKARFVLATDGDTFEAEDVGSEEHTSELQSLMRISYAVFCLNQKTTIPQQFDVYSNIRMTK